MILVSITPNPMHRGHVYFDIEAHFQLSITGVTMDLVKHYKPSRHD